jgi:hypothetical protein
MGIYLYCIVRWFCAEVLAECGVPDSYIEGDTRKFKGGVTIVVAAVGQFYVILEY